MVDVKIFRIPADAGLAEFKMKLGAVLRLSTDVEGGGTPTGTTLDEEMAELTYADGVDERYVGFTRHALLHCLTRLASFATTYA